MHLQTNPRRTTQVYPTRFTESYIDSIIWQQLIDIKMGLELKKMFPNLDFNLSEVAFNVVKGFLGQNIRFYRVEEIGELITLLENSDTRKRLIPVILSGMKEECHRTKPPYDSGKFKGVFIGSNGIKLCYVNENGNEISIAADPTELKYYNITET